MRKQHLNAFPITARSLECFGLGQRPSNVTSFLVDAARHPTEGRFWAALRLQQAATAVTHAGHLRSVSPSLTNLPVVVRVLPAGHVYTLRCLSNVKSSRLKVPSSRLDLSMTGMCGAIFLSWTSQLQICSRAVGCIGRQPLGLQTKALLGSVDHSLGRADLGLPDGAGGFNIHDDAKLHVDQIIVGISEEGWPAHRARPLGRWVGR